MTSSTASRFFCFSILFSLVQGLSFAQTASNTSSERTVSDAYQSALLLSPEIKAAQDRIQSLTSRREAASSLTSQPLTLEGAYRTDSLHNDQGLREVTLGLSAPVWNWNEKSSTQAVRDAEIQEAQLQLEQTKLEIASQVRQLVWDLQAAQVDVDIAKLRFASVSDLLASVNKRVNAGELAETDLMQARVLLSQAEAELARAMGLLEQAKASYFAGVGLQASTVEKYLPENATISEGVKVADHPSLKLAQVQLVLNQYQKKLTATQSRPNPEIGLALISERAAFFSGQDKSLVLSTRIPLGSSSEYKSRVLEAQANETAANARLLNTQRNLGSRSRLAESELELFSRLRLAATAQANLSQKVYELHKKAFELGETDLATLIRLEQTAVEANRLNSKATIEYAAKVSAYLQAMGLLP